MEARQPGARRRRRLDAQHDSATGHLPGGRGRPDFKSGMDNRVRTSARKASWICCGCCLTRGRSGAAGSAVVFRAPSLCGGDGAEPSPGLS